MRSASGGLPFGVGWMKQSSRNGANDTWGRAMSQAVVSGQTRRSIWAAATNPMPMHTATMTRLLSVSLPSCAVRSHRSNISAIGAPMHTDRRMAPKSRRSRVRTNSMVALNTACYRKLTTLCISRVKNRPLRITT